MLSMALELASEDPSYEDVASKFFEHFVAITDAMNTLGGSGLWDEEDGFYYDQLSVERQHVPLKVRSMVGLVPLFAVEILEEDVIAQLPGFRKRMQWFLDNRQDLARHITYMEEPEKTHGHRLLAVPTRDRLERVLRYLLDEREFLSPHGIRALSRIHAEQPYVFHVMGQEYRVEYDPGESTTGVFGGNSNWRGPVWFPVNYLLVEALERYHHFYGDGLPVECPVGSGRWMTLSEVSREIARRLSSLFLPDARRAQALPRRRPRASRPIPTGRTSFSFTSISTATRGGEPAQSHQTGWTALVVRCLEDLARTRRKEKARRGAALLPAG